LPTGAGYHVSGRFVLASGGVRAFAALEMKVRSADLASKNGEGEAEN
jgi:hypothetical protein